MSFCCCSYLFVVVADFADLLHPCTADIRLQMQREQCVIHSVMQCVVCVVVCSVMQLQSVGYVQNVCGSV